jgi:hypothetical protein
MSVLFDRFFYNYLSSSSISWLDPESKPGFERKFPLLMGFLPALVKGCLEGFADWRIRRQCHLKELRDQMNVPAIFNAAIYIYTKSITKTEIERKNLKYTKSYGRTVVTRSCTWLKSKGYCRSMQRRHRGLQQNRGKECPFGLRHLPSLSSEL